MIKKKKAKITNQKNVQRIVEERRQPEKNNKAPRVTEGLRYAHEDSNLKPLAPEANALSN